MPSSNRLGTALRKARKAASFTLEDGPARLGVNKNTLGKYERGAVLPDIEFLLGAARVLNVPFLSLLALRLIDSPDRDGAIESEALEVDARLSEPASATRSRSMLGFAETDQAGWYHFSETTPHSGKTGFKEPFVSFRLPGPELAIFGIPPDSVCFCATGQTPEPGDLVLVYLNNGQAGFRRFVSGDEDWLTLEGMLHHDQTDGPTLISDRLNRRFVKSLMPIVQFRTPTA